MTQPAIDETLAELARELAAGGAAAVALLGSHARGEGHRYSDFDVVAFGSGRSRMRSWQGLLVSEQWLDRARVSASLVEPGAVGQVVPGWRSAQVLYDPDGLIAGVKEEVAAWSWEQLGDGPDRVVAARVADHVEEVFRLVGHLGSGRWMAAACIRSILALHCAPVMAIHLRLLYGSENRLWSAVADAMGPAWRAAQDAAFGFGGEDVVESSRAALELYRLTAETTEPLLDEDQAEVVTMARRAIAESSGSTSIRE